MSVRVLLADDHSEFRKAVRELLEADPDIAIIAEVGDGKALMATVPHTNPDVICLDLSMPGVNGLDATRQILAAQPHIRVIVISGHADESYVQGMLDSGAVGYVLKDDVGQHLIPAIRSVQRNEIYLCPQVAAASTPGTPQHVAPAVRLEPRERQVLRLIADGHDRATIAERLQMSRTTVDVHCRNIMRKLDLNGEAELGRFAAAYVHDSAPANPDTIGRK
ncbi:MAG TPA: response regulator transcription factor [Burkholderiales bacterium]|nr:response regulator transcription factor [Burkholderiales bacterium]